jgi:hypothetical protein
MTKITGNLQEDLCTCMVISRSVFLRMRNVSDRSCRRNQNTYLMFDSFFLTGNLQEGLCTCMVISRSVFLRMRNVSDRSCRRNQNTYLMFDSFFFPKIVPFMS